jgi:hypothetical protein
MSLPSPTRLTAATATGTPTLSIIDCSVGGLLVQATEPFPIGSVVHLRLSTADGGACGTFALRCLHAHRTVGPDHVPALVFIHPPDGRTRDLLTGLGHAGRPQPPRESRRLLRFTGGPPD